MCVWQSHAPGGTSKFTGVTGCDAMAHTGVARRVNALIAAPETPINTLRREIIDILQPNPRDDRESVQSP